MIERPRLAAALDTAAPVLVTACVLAAAAGSSIQRDIFDAGRPARWGFLALLLAFALVRAAVSVSTWSFPPRAAFALAVFCGLSFVSVAWSVNPHGTLVRAVGLGVVVVAAAALAGCVSSSPTLAGRLLDGVLAAAAVVALAGFVYWLVSPSRAAIPATVEYPSRYQGIEQNPNTAAMLLAIGMPLALVRILRARDAATRIGFGLLLLAFGASITASGSRGGLAAGFAGLLAVSALAPLSWRRRIAVALAVVVGLVVGAKAMTIPKALPATTHATPATPAGNPAATPAGTPAPLSRDAELVLPLNQEIGNPWWTHRAGDAKRSLFNTSVRMRAWEGTVKRAFRRPLLGYGFGAEQWAFVNRYYAYNSENPENGYLGIFLQLGLVGLSVFLVMAALLVLPGIRAYIRGQRRDGNALAALGASAAALALGLSQSYFHGPGSIAYIALWISLLLAAVIARPKRDASS